MRTPAFSHAAPVPLHAPRAPSVSPLERLHARARTQPRPCMTAEQLPAGVSPIPPPPVPAPKPPPPLPPSPEILSTPLPAALYSLFARREQPEDALAFLTERTVWETPLFDATGFSEVTDAFSSFLSFAVNPTLAIYNLDLHRNTFSWTLSFNYPLPWRPRVSVAGATKTDSLVAPTRIVDDWFVAPGTLIAQALPKLPDIIWLFPGPHAETDAGQRRVLRRARGYSIIRQAARAELRARGNIKRFETDLIWAIPALPEQAFEGGLRKREKYWTASPICLREIGDGRLEWAAAVPGALVGSSNVLAAAPTADDVRIEVADERVMAVTRFGGFAKREVVEQRLKQLLERLREDGVVQDVGRERVWVRVYDSKIGFNTRGVLSMAMYGSSTGVPRVNEIAIDLSGVVREEDL